MQINDPLVEKIFEALRAETGSPTDKWEALARAARIADNYAGATAPSGAFESLFTSETAGHAAIER